MIKLQTKDLYDIVSGRHPDWPGGLTPDQTHHAYNGLDSGVTFRVWRALDETIRSRNDPCAATSYRFVRAMQGPSMAMVLRGTMIQQRVRQEETHRCQVKRAQVQAILDRLADAIWGPEEYVEVIKTKEWQTPIGKRGLPLSPRLVTTSVSIPRTRPRGLNPASPNQVLAFFNVALGLPVEYEIRKTPQGNIRTPTADDKALRKWAKARMKGPGVNPRDRSVEPVLFAQPFVSLILTLRDLDKQLGVLRTPLDPDGRMRCSYNVVGTENGRWSSSKNAYGRGSNLQNISDTMRRMFCADDGYVLISTDLEQAESRLVAGLVWQVTGDRTYLNACLSGDLHTQVCMMAWLELGWTSDDPNDAANRAIAERKYPNLGGLSYRDVAKRIGHGSNYRGSAYGISQAVGIPSYIVEEFQFRYFAAFPAIRQWHDRVQAELRSVQYLDTPLFRRRIFFGRPNEDKTLREAIAFSPQSTVGELLNLIMYRVWERSLLPLNHPFHLPIQLLLQNHDAFLCQTLETNDLPSIINAINEEFNRATVPFERNGETLDLLIPGEFITGWNWAKESKEFEDGNPDGLRKWKGSETRVRQQRATATAADWLGKPLPPWGAFSSPRRNSTRSV